MTDPNKGLRGMLMYHGMGTGKTTTAAACYLNCPDDIPLVVACPVSLVDMWKSALARLLPGASPPPRIVSYGALTASDVRGAMLVADECHEMDETHAMAAKACQKCVFLSGTPVSKDILDLRLFCNLCAVPGREPLPWSADEFRKAYARPMTSRERAWFLWVLPVAHTAVTAATVVMAYGIAGYATAGLTAAAALDASTGGAVSRIGKAAVSTIGRAAIRAGATGAVGTSLMAVVGNDAITKLVSGGILEAVRRGASSRFDVRKIVGDVAKCISYIPSESGDGPGGLDMPDVIDVSEWVDMTPAQMDALNMACFPPLVSSELVSRMNLSEDDATGAVTRQMTSKDSPKGGTDALVRWGRAAGSVGGPDDPPPKFRMVEASVRAMLAARTDGRALVYSCFHGVSRAVLDHLVGALRGTTVVFLSGPGDVDRFNRPGAEARVAVLSPDLSRGVGVNRVAEFHILEHQEGFQEHAQLRARVVRHESHPRGFGPVRVVTWGSRFPEGSDTMTAVYQKVKEISSTTMQRTNTTAGVVVGTMLAAIPADLPTYTRHRSSLRDHSPLTLSWARAASSEVCPDQVCASRVASTRSVVQGVQGAIVTIKSEEASAPKTPLKCCVVWSPGDSCPADSNACSRASHKVLDAVTEAVSRAAKPRRPIGDTRARAA